MAAVTSSEFIHLRGGINATLGELNVNLGAINVKLAKVLDVMTALTNTVAKKPLAEFSAVCLHCQKEVYFTKQYARLSAGEIIISCPSCGVQLSEYTRATTLEAALERFRVKEFKPHTITPRVL